MQMIVRKKLRLIALTACLMCSVPLFADDRSWTIPAVLFLGTPGADATKTGDAKYLNEGVDPGLIAWDGVPAEALKL